MGSLTNFLANRKTPGLHLDQLNLFEGRPVPTGLALLVPVDQLDEDPDNPRKEFPPEAIEELAQDIAQRGILQPIVVSDLLDSPEAKKLFLGNANDSRGVVDILEQRIEREAQTLDQISLRLSHALPNPERMREQIEQWQQRLMQSAHVYFNNIKRNQAHWLTQLETLNPQRTLERGYAVILDKQKKAARNPRDLQMDEDYLIKLAEGQIAVSFKKPAL